MTQQRTLDMFEELDWFRSCGVSAALTLQTLGRKWETVQRTCYRLDRHDLAAWIQEDFGEIRWAEDKARAS